MFTIPEVPQPTASHVSRLFCEMALLPSFKKYAALLIGDSVQLLRGAETSLQDRKHLLTGIYSMMELCTEFERQQIFNALDATGRSIFQSMFSDFEKDFKFKGKL